MLYRKGDWRVMVEVLALQALLWACAPVKCQKLDIVIDKHPSLVVPAGQVTVSCDGQVILEAQAPTVTTGR